MGLLKDIYGIIASEPKAKQQIEKAVLKFLRGGFWAAPTRQGRKDKLEPLIAQLTKDDFSSRFEDPLAFFGALLGMIVETVYTAGRGCLIEKLFLPGYRFYFPAPAKEPSLRLHKPLLGKDAYWGLDNQDKSKYIFYAFKKGDGGQVDISKAGAKLTEIALANPIIGEAAAFTKWLRDEGHEVTRLFGISRQSDTAALHYLSDSDWENYLSLNYTDKTTKASVADELTAVLKFILV